MVVGDVDFSVLKAGTQPEQWEETRMFLLNNQLGMDEDIGHFVLARRAQQLVGCAGLAGNVIKCVAIAADMRGEHLAARLLVEVENLALTMGYFHLFLCTHVSNMERFQRCGFWPLATSDNSVVLMENTPSGLQRYCQQLATLRHPGNRIGSIVMNANPFTLGHQYLVETTAKVCDWLHLFVVSEDASFFPYRERLAMVRAGVEGISNLTVHEGSPYLISRATFPGYFLKERQQVEQAWCTLDLALFRHYLAPALGITHRFVGSEPFCLVTRAYNRAMQQFLNDPTDSAPGIQVVEIPRKCRDSGEAISASEVRRLLKEQQFPRIREIVPESTFDYLVRQYCAEVA